MPLPVPSRGKQERRCDESGWWPQHHMCIGVVAGRCQHLMNLPTDSRNYRSKVRCLEIVRGSTSSSRTLLLVVQSCYCTKGGDFCEQDDGVEMMRQLEDTERSLRTADTNHTTERRALDASLAQLRAQLQV